MTISAGTVSILGGTPVLNRYLEPEVYFPWPLPRRVLLLAAVNAARDTNRRKRRNGADTSSGCYQSYGQTFFGFLPIENVFGSADTNS